FQQELDLDTSTNYASLTGISPYLNDVVQSIPSTANQEITCSPHRDRYQCSWPGLAPQVVPSSSDPKGWLTYNITKSPSKSHAEISLSGKNTRACKLTFANPVSNFSVSGSAYDPRFPYSASKGTKEIDLWSRTWENTWTVELDWSEGQSLSGKVTCLWSDNNQQGLIPALDEIRQYVPAW